MNFLPLLPVVTRGAAWAFSIVSLGRAIVNGRSRYRLFLLFPIPMSGRVGVNSRFTLGSVQKFRNPVIS